MIHSRPLNVLFIILLLLSVNTICFSESKSSPKQLDGRIWEDFGTTIEGHWYYNKHYLKKSDNILSLWTNHIVTDEVRNQMIENQKKLYSVEESMKYHGYDHEKSLWDIDCKKGYSKLQCTIFIDYYGTVIDREDTVGEWEPIAPDSIFETLYQKICVIRKKPLKKK